MRYQWLLFICCLPAGLWGADTLPAAEPAKPNIVFILADDMGYGDVQAYNPNSRIATPNLNRLAAAGMMFTDAHTPSAVCTPTRYGLLTGRYCWRSRLKRGVQNGYGPPLIESDRPTVGLLLQRHGYYTGIVGKWHLGLGFAKDDEGNFDFSQPVDHGPNQLGFDFSYIIPASLDFPPYVYIQGGTPTQFPGLMQAAQKFPAFLRKGERSPDLVMEECLDHLTSQAVAFIERQAERDGPYALYFPLTAPHKPVLPHRRFRGRSGLGPYGDFIMQVDAVVGRILEAVAGSGQADNTLLIYSSDNGSFMYRAQEGEPDHVTQESVQAYAAGHHTANSIYRGTKADIWEAGHRVPFIVRWPAVVAAGTRCDETICLTDFFATVAEMVGEQVGPAAGPDSFSLLPLLAGKDRTTARPPVIHHSAAGMFAIRDGDWKLVLGDGSGGREKPKGSPFQRPYQLFQLTSDPSERQNVIEQHPQIARVLEAKCLAIRDRGHSHAP